MKTQTRFTHTDNKRTHGSTSDRRLNLRHGLVLMCALVTGVVTGTSSIAIAQGDPMTLQMKPALGRGFNKASGSPARVATRNASAQSVKRVTKRNADVKMIRSDVVSAPSSFTRANLGAALSSTTDEQNSLGIRNAGLRGQGVSREDSSIEFASLQNEDPETGVRAQSDIGSQIRMQNYRRGNKKTQGDTRFGGLAGNQLKAQSSKQNVSAASKSSGQISASSAAPKSRKIQQKKSLRTSDLATDSGETSSAVESSAAQAAPSRLDVGHVSREMVAIRPTREAKPEQAAGLSAKFLNAFIFNNQKNENNVSRYELTPSYGFLPNFSFDTFFAGTAPMQKTDDNKSFYFDNIEAGLTASVENKPLPNAMSWGASLNGGAVLPTGDDSQLRTFRGGWGISQAVDLDARVVLFKLSNRYYSYYYQYKDYYPEGADTTDSKSLIANDDYYLENRLDFNVPLGSRSLLWKNDWRNMYTRKMYGDPDQVLMMRTRLGYKVSSFLWVNAGVGASKPHNDAGSLFDSKRMNVNLVLFWSI